jgi:hypothetical protein
LNMTVLENVMAAEYGNTKATVFEAMFQLPRARREEKRIRAIAEIFPQRRYECAQALAVERGNDSNELLGVRTGTRGGRKRAETIQQRLHPFA